MTFQSGLGGDRPDALQIGGAPVGAGICVTGIRLSETVLHQAQAYQRGQDVNLNAVAIEPGHTRLSVILLLI